MSTEAITQEAEETSLITEVVTTSRPLQEEMPFAVVMGREITALPKDLYIPPDALEVFLEAFEGPLDLLLYDQASKFGYS